MLSGGNQTDGNTLERFLTPYQYSRLPLLKGKEIKFKEMGIEKIYSLHVIYFISPFQ